MYIDNNKSTVVPQFIVTEPTTIILRILATNSRPIFSKPAKLWFLTATKILAGKFLYVNDAMFDQFFIYGETHEQ
jgi:hypothetical protein